MKRMIGIFFGVASLLYSNGYAEIYLWPMHGERQLSSSFGEYREGHFHAGIDLRTLGQTGLPCLAIGDGSVVRLKIAPAGYGKALYLELDDGRVAVYAHLIGFQYRLDSLAYHYRLARGASWCDIPIPAGAFRYAVGDTVCFSGATGTSAPHLHFELRDGAGRPFNPLEELYTVPDGRSPIISGLEVVPLSAGSIVNGSPLPVTALFRASGSNAYVLPDTLQLEGRFGFAVSVWDEQGFGEYALAPFSTEIFVDGIPLYRSRNRVFSYEQTAESTIEYDLLGEGPAGRYLVMYHKSGSSRADRGGPGMIHADRGYPDGLMIGTGLHEGRIEATDAAGNTAVARFAFALHRFPVVETARKLLTGKEAIIRASDPDGGALVERLYESPDGGERWIRIPLEPRGAYLAGSTSLNEGGLYRYVVRDDEGAVRERYFAEPKPMDIGGKVYCECTPEATSDGVVIRVVTDQPLAEDPQVAIGGGTPLDSCRVYRSGSRSFTLLCGLDAFEDAVNVVSITGRDYRGFPLRAHSAFRFYRMRTGTRARFAVSDTVRAVLESPSVRGTAPCLVRELPAPGEQPPGLRAVSSPFSVDFPVDKMALPPRIACETSADIGLFRWEKDSAWKCVGVPAGQGGAVALDKPGIYAFFSDGLPPEMEHVASELLPPGSGFFGTVRYYIPVREEGSGVDPFSPTATVNGEPVVCEWDEFRDRLLLPIPATFPRGISKLHVELGDRTGNRSAGDFSFVIQ